MSDPVVVEVPEWAVEDVEDEEALKGYISENFEEEFRDAIDFTGNVHDDRCQTDAVSVLDVECDGDAVAIHYEVEYSAHHACRDVSYSETAQRVLRGVRDGRKLTFKRFEWPERRSTIDEF